jgi:uncharacterized membrane protein YgcG
MHRVFPDTNAQWLGYLLPCLSVIYAFSIGSNYENDVDSFWLSLWIFIFIPSIYIWYARRMKISTPEGVAIASEIEGLVMYMKTAEEHRLNMLNPPEQTPALFEKLLPYALVLDLTNEWCEKFDNVLKNAKYYPKWYNSDFMDDFTTAAFAAALSASFETAVDRAKADTSSSSSSGSRNWSSGSSDSGYSGGGGGGGGGRGW